MIDLCQWRVCIGLFNGGSGGCHPLPTEKPFVGLDPLMYLLLGAVSSLVSLVVGVIGAVNTTEDTRAEGKRVCITPGFGTSTDLKPWAC